MRSRMECWSIALPDEPRRLLAIFHADGRVEGDSPVVEDLKKYSEMGELVEHTFDPRNPGDDPGLRRTSLGDPLFLYVLANYFNRQTGGYIQFLVYP